MTQARMAQACTILVLFLAAISEVEIRVFVCGLFCLTQGFAIAQSFYSDFPIFPPQVRTMVRSRPFWFY